MGLGLLTAFGAIGSFSRVYSGTKDQASKEKDWAKMESMDQGCYFRAHIVHVSMSWGVKNQFGWICLPFDTTFTKCVMQTCMIVQWLGFGITGLTILISWYSTPYTYLCCTCALISNWVSFVFMVTSEAWMIGWSVDHHNLPTFGMPGGILGIAGVARAVLYNDPVTNWLLFPWCLFILVFFLTLNVIAFLFGSRSMFPGFRGNEHCNIVLYKWYVCEGLQIRAVTM